MFHYFFCFMTHHQTYSQPSSACQRKFMNVFQVYLKTTESKTDEEYTAGKRKCCGNPLDKFLNFKIAYFVLFLSQNTIIVLLFFKIFISSLYNKTLNVCSLGK